MQNREVPSRLPTVFVKSDDNSRQQINLIFPDMTRPKLNWFRSAATKTGSGKGSLF